MQLGKYLALAALTASMAASAQQTDGSNGTLFDLMTAPNNTLGVSRFVDLVSSDPGYQPVIDLLKSDGNYTVFAPNDRFLRKMVPVWKAYARAHHLNATSDYPPANFTVDNLTILDILTYHVVGEKVRLGGLTSNTDIVHSLLNKTGVDLLGTGLPILIESNASAAQLANQSWVGANGKYLEYQVGNGVDSADVKKKDLSASNGYLNVIDSVLIPPLSPTTVIGEEDDLERLSALLEAYPSVANFLNTTSNFTLFAPNDKALKNFKARGLSNETVENLLKTHIVSGVYYSTNITEAAAANNGQVQLTSINNVSLPVTVNSTTGVVRLNNTIRVVDTNAFFNNGVMHIIDGVLTPPAM